MKNFKTTGLILNSVGVLLICATILLNRSAIETNDFVMGLMTGAGIGLCVLGLFFLGRMRSRSESK